MGVDVIRNYALKFLSQSPSWALISLTAHTCRFGLYDVRTKQASPNTNVTPLLWGPRGGGGMPSMQYMAALRAPPWATTSEEGSPRLMTRWRARDAT